MEIKFRAKLKNINANEDGIVIKLEKQANYAKQIVELMPKVGMYAYITVEDEQMEIQDLEAEYEQPLEGQTAIEAEIIDDSHVLPLNLAIVQGTFIAEEE